MDVLGNRHGDGEVIVHICLLTPPPIRVLTFYQDDDWYLPQFQYPCDSYCSTSCCLDLQNSLGPEFKNVNLSVVAELHPNDQDSASYFYNPEGKNHVLLVEGDAEQYLFRNLPSHAKWMDHAELLEMVQSDEHSWNYSSSQSAIQRFLDSFDPTGTLVLYRQGDWLSKAGSYLKSVLHELDLEIISDVLREAWASPSEVFKMETTRGWYYLKSPPPGSREVSVTACLSRMFPQDTLHVISANTELNCFVSEGIETAGLHNFSMKSMLRKHGKVQVQSMEKVKQLLDAGLPDRSPAVLTKEVDEWIENPVVKKALDDEKCTPLDFKRRSQQLCTLLERSSVPVALVHGDVCLRNCGVRRARGTNTQLLFDWQYSCLSHPFCDLYEISADRTWFHEYFQLWERFISIQEANRILNTAKTLGRMIRLSFALNAEAAAVKESFKRPFNSYARRCVQSIISDFRQSQVRI